MSDSNGCIYDPEGIRLDVVKDIKLRHRGRIREYAQLVPGSEFRSDFRDLWSVPCDVALPCATQNEIDAETARRIVRGGCHGAGGGGQYAQHPCRHRGAAGGRRPVRPRQGANAGGVAVSGLEMCQNSMRLAWTFDEVDQRLHQIMLDIFHNIYDASVEYGCPRQPVGRCQYRRLPQGGGRHAGAGCLLTLLSFSSLLFFSTIGKGPGA